MIQIASELWGLIKLIRSWVDAGLSADEIRSRLADPEGVGADLLDRAVERRRVGAAYLGTANVRIDVEPDPEPRGPLQPLSIGFGEPPKDKRKRRGNR